MARRRKTSPSRDIKAAPAEAPATCAALDTEAPPEPAATPRIEYPEPHHASVIELSESALRNNLRFLRKQLPPATVYCSVIKGNAYGHGIEQFVPLAERCRVRHFAVFSATEALRAHRVATQGSQVMIMGLIDNHELEWAVDHGISFWVFDLDRLRAALDAARTVKRPALIHLELETGLNRTGLQDDELELAMELVRANPEQLTVLGTCTHLSGAESVGNYLRIQQQIKRFRELCELFQERGVPLGRRHMACSAAVFTYPETALDMVRFGIAQYGFWPSHETQMHYFLEHGIDSPARHRDPLRRVLRWTSRVMSLKKVPPGSFIGYGTTYLTNRRQIIAAVPVGYFHGFLRGLSNMGYVAVRGKRAAVVGTVNMNMMLVDVTDIPGVQKGDEVLLIGRQKSMHITVGSFSDMVRHLNYEVLVRLPAEVPRVVIK